MIYIYIFPACFLILISSNPNYISKPLSRKLLRFQNVLDFVPISSKSILDVGTDHGLLALALYNNSILKVFATELSPVAARDGILSLIKTKYLESKIDVMIGFGFQPLVDRGIDDLDVIVICGIGSNTMLRILSNNPTCQLVSTAESENSSIQDVNFVQLRSLGVKKIILQPWPSNLLPILYLSRVLLQGGWRFCEQGICMHEQRHYLTTSFIFESIRTMKNSEFSRIDNVFLEFPLHKKFTLNLMEAEENRIYSDYLKKQKMLLFEKYNISASHKYADLNNSEMYKNSIEKLLEHLTID